MLPQTRVKTPAQGYRGLKWQPAPEKLNLGTGEVHVWLAGLDVGPQVHEGLQATLASDELARAFHLCEPVDQWRSVAAHGVLRDILARYTRRRPEELHFREGALGKPELAEGRACKDIRFNLAHSAGVAVYAVARNRDVGIDLEKVEPALAGPHLVQRFFSPQEASVISTLSADSQAEAFFDCWTRKEAYLKALGKGSLVSPGSFSVSVLSPEPELLGDPDGSEWTVLSLRTIPRFMMAVAAEGVGWSVKLWGWRGFEFSERGDRIDSAEEHVPVGAVHSPAGRELNEAGRSTVRWPRASKTVH